MSDLHNINWASPDAHERLVIKQRIAELEAQLADEKRYRQQAEEAYAAKEVHVPLGPLVGSQTILNQQVYIQRLKAGIQDYLNAEDVSIEMEMRRQLRTLLNQHGESTE